MTKKNSGEAGGKKILTKKLAAGFLAVALFGLVILLIDFIGPSKIHLNNDVVFGFECLRAHDLIVQEYDNDGNLWATRGMKIYKLEKGSMEFKRIAHVPTGLTVLWLRDFTIVRKILLRPECVEMTVAGNGDIHVLSAGRMWLLIKGSKKFIETHRLAHYGFGDQGIRNDGILSVNENSVFLGEYFQNPSRSKVDILRSADNGKAWKTAYSFQPGLIRHIHVLQKDPYSDSLWVCTGDSDEESMIAWSSDGFKTLNKVGAGSQLWRVCQLVFTEDEVIWGTDNGDEKISGIYGLNRKTSELKKYCSVPGAIFYGTRLQGGTIVMSTNRERMENEKDDKVRLYIKPEGEDIRVVECGTWNHNKPGFWYKYALLRLQRYQGGPALAISFLNQKELPDSELIIVSEEDLLKTGELTGNKINE